MAADWHTRAHFALNTAAHRPVFTAGHAGLIAKLAERSCAERAIQRACEATVAICVRCGPLIEVIHIVAVVLLGTTMLVNFTLLGIVRGWSAAQTAHTVKIYTHVALVVVYVTGALLFLSDPWRYYASNAFGPKILMLVLATLFQFTLYPRALRIDPTFTRIPARLAACVSLALWFSIGAAGRAIGWV